MTTSAVSHIPEKPFSPWLLADLVQKESTRPQMTTLPELWSDTSTQSVVVLKREPGRTALAETVATKESTATTRQSYDLVDNDHQTNTTTLSALAVLLEESAKAGDHRTFAALVKTTDWSTRTPEELIAAIDLALSQDMAALAIKLAQLGGRLFPDHERIQRAAQVLAPPVVRRVRPPRARGLRASMAWLREHASEYRGRWMAVRKGQLLGVADSLEELMPIVGNGENAVNTIVMRVP
jgi:hypothetical protein